MDIVNSMSAMRTHAALRKVLRKYNILRENQKPHFNKNLQEKIMIKSCLKNKSNNLIDIAKFKWQRHLVVNLNNLVACSTILKF